MRIRIQFEDRVGIAHEILAVLANRCLNVVSVEVDPPNIYIDSPELGAVLLPDLCQACRAVPGVCDIAIMDVLPGIRRRLNMEAMLRAMEDPVLAIDGQGAIVIANAAAAAVAGMEEHALCSLNLVDVLGDDALFAELRSSGFRLPSREVLLHGEPFFMDATPVTEPAHSGQTIGAVLTLHAPSRIGGRLHALQHPANAGFDAIVGVSEALRVLKARAARMAAVDAPLLVTGETGTGKELLAQACHAASARTHAPFLELNCAALPESLAESELFGYTAGTFTGAQRGGKPGLFEMADGGTIFLDEIGEMSLYLQAKLLRFLNDGKFRRIGSDKEVRANVRIISATHRNLAERVRAGAFREDLFYRLNVLHLEMPALRDRPEDILPLARHFIERACAQAQKPVARLSAAAGAALQTQSWAGNVRQLQNVVFRAITMSDRRILEAEDFDCAQESVADANWSLEQVHSLTQAVEAYEKRLLAQLYPHFPSSRKLAQRLLASHSVIATKLRKYGLPEKRA